MRTLAQRIKEVRLESGKSQTEFGKIGGVGKTTQINYESGKRKPDSDYFQALHKSGIDISYILTGERESNVKSLSHLKEEKESQHAKLEVVNLFESFVEDAEMRREAALPLFVGQYNSGHLGKVAGIHKVSAADVYEWLSIKSSSKGSKSGTAADEAFASIPLYNVEASAGHGSLVEHEQVERMLIFRKDWIRNELHVNPNDLYLVSVQGDSMYPTISPNDVILVHDDKDSAIVPCDGIYLLRLDGSLLVKRLQRKPNNRVVVMSDNPSYAPYEVDVDDFTDADFCIIGRVVWSGRKM